MIRRVSSSEGCRLRPRGDQKMDRDTQVGLIGDQSWSIGDAAPFASEFTISEGQRKPIQHTALLVEQGRHRFYTLVLPSSLLAASCVVETRNDNPENGFQNLAVLYIYCTCVHVSSVATVTPYTERRIECR